MSDNWPKHPNGSPKKIGEMTRDERRIVLQNAVNRLAAEFSRPETQNAFARAVAAPKKSI